MNWLDWVIVVVIGVASLNGLRRGFVLTLTRLAGQLAAIVAAFVLTKPAVALLESRFAAATWLADLLSRYIRLPAEFARTTVTDLSSGQLWALLDSSGLPEQYKDAVVTWIAESPGPTVVTVTLARFIHQGLAMLLLNVITFLVLLGLARWVISLFGKGISGTMHSIGAGWLDHLGGLALGMAQGALLSCLLLGLALPVLATGSLETLNQAVNESVLAVPLLAGFYSVAPWLRQIGQNIWERVR